jgi:hypothetical protein
VSKSGYGSTTESASFKVITKADELILPSNELICDDGIDNDNDGLVDDGDPDCLPAVDPCIENPELPDCPPLIDPCIENPDLPECQPVDPCIENPDLEECESPPPIDPCEENPDSEECDSDEPEPEPEPEPGEGEDNGDEGDDEN